MDSSLADILEKKMKALHMGDARLAALANDLMGNSQFLHRSTIRNWRTGVSKSAQDWRQMIAIANVLQLEQDETDALLRSSNCPSLNVLRPVATEEDQRLFNRWQQNDIQQEIIPAEVSQPAQPIIEATTPSRSQRVVQILGLIGLVALAGFIFFVLRPKNAHVVSAELRADWSFNDSNGTTVIDALQQGMDGTLENGVAWVETPSGRVLQFDGEDDFVDIPNHPLLNDAPFSISLWFRIDELPTKRNENAIIVRKKQIGAPWASWDINVLSTDHIFFNIYPADNDKPIRVVSDLPAQAGVWYHVIGVLDEDYVMHLYINGDKQTETAEVDGLFESDGTLRWGAGSATNERLVGAIRSVQIYGEGLTKADVATLYKNEQ